MSADQSELDSGTYVARTLSVTLGIVAGAWLLVSLALYSDAGTPFITPPWFLLWMVGLALVPATIVGVVVVAVDHRKEPQRWAWLGAFAAPLALIIWLAAVFTNGPFTVRLALSQSELREFAESHAEGDRDDSYDGRVGLFHVQEYDVVEGCTRFITDDSFLDHAGFVYCPNGNRPPYVGEDRYTRLHGNWWHWYRSW